MELMDLRYRQLNALGLLAISAVLAYAVASQFITGELPCPLCLLQRIGFVAVGVGLLMNVMLGPRPSHYGFAIISAIAGGIFALRQVSLHVIPGTPPYGDPFFGLHFYTWAFILFAVMIAGLAALVGIRAQYADTAGYQALRLQPLLCKLGVVALLLMIAANALLTFVECGPMQCPDNPTDYWLLR